MTSQYHFDYDVSNSNCDIFGCKCERRFWVMFSLKPLQTRVILNVGEKESTPVLVGKT